jgi:hypothetical protein
LATLENNLIKQLIGLDAPVKIQDGDALVLIRQLEVFNETNFTKSLTCFESL